jgi:hypothetical protein
VLKTLLRQHKHHHTQLDQLKTTLSFTSRFTSAVSQPGTLRLTAQENSQCCPGRICSDPLQPNFPQTNAKRAPGWRYRASGHSGIAFLVEFLDDTIKTPDEVKEILQLPVIGLIGELA